MPLTSKFLVKTLKEYKYILTSQRWNYMNFRKQNNTIIIPKHKELKS